jgi:hypothetical protein
MIKKSTLWTEFYLPFEAPAIVFSSLTRQYQLLFYLKIVHFKKSSAGRIIPHGVPQVEDRCSVRYGSRQGLINGMGQTNQIPWPLRVYHIFCTLCHIAPPLWKRQPTFESRNVLFRLNFKCHDFEQKVIEHKKCVLWHLIERLPEIFFHFECNSAKRYEYNERT